MAQEFIAWANPAEYDEDLAQEENYNWRLNFQLLSLFIIQMFIILLYFLRACLER